MVTTGIIPPSISSEMAALLDDIKVKGQQAKDWRDSAPSSESYMDSKRKQLEALERDNKFFMYNLMADYRNFTDSDPFKTLLAYIPDLAIKYRRGAVFYLTLAEYLRAKKLGELYTVSHTAMPKILSGYMVDLGIIKKRYDSGTIQFPKIAGLMANLIVKYRPIVPLSIKHDPYLDINENFAIYHGVCICADYQNGVEAIRAFQKAPQHEPFYKDTKYLLQRNFTPENLILVFKTLCLYQFPEALKRPTDG